MKKRNLLLKLFCCACIGLSLCLSLGCATTYGPMSITGGYEDAHIRDNLYFVEVGSIGYSYLSTAVTHLHRRAQEICVANGYTTYKLKDERLDPVSAYVECLKRAQ